MCTQHTGDQQSLRRMTEGLTGQLNQNTEQHHQCMSSLTRSGGDHPSGLVLLYFINKSTAHPTLSVLKSS